MVENLFELFSKPLIDALKERGFTEPTEPQKMLFPVINSGKNALLMAPTGTGKTEAAFLPILDKMIKEGKEKRKGISLLYITPLRALNRDMLERMQWWCKKFDIRLGVRHGDTSIAERTNMTIVPPDILITTPETLQIMLVGKRIRKSLETIRWIIVDEVHELAEDKRGSQLTVGLERLKEITVNEPQIIGLSATVGSPESMASFLAGSSEKCVIVSVPVEKTIHVSIVMPKPESKDTELAEKIYTFPQVASRLRYIRKIVEQYKSVLIFTNTRSEAEALANRFRVWEQDFPIGIHHSSLSKATREAVEIALKEGKLWGVICTSSLELGIDVGFLKHVIQYNSPRQVTRLVQRIGRSGHRVKEPSVGTVITQDSDDMLEACVLYSRARKGILEPLNPYRNPSDVAIHQIAGLLIERQTINTDELLDFLKRSYAFSEMKEDDLKSLIQYMIERYPKLAIYSEAERALKRPRDVKPLFEYYFENVSMIPDEKQYLVFEKDKLVGVLDEAFVSEYGEIGTKFVESGRCWRIEQVYENKVFVKQEDDPTGSVPNWVGDEIPVPFDVAQEVGQIRRIYAEGLMQDKREAVSKELAAKYDLPVQLLNEAMQEVIEQISLGMPVPSDSVITIEKWEKYCIIMSSFGHKVNRLLGRIIAYIISEQTGQSVPVQQDPYRIILECEIMPENIMRIFDKLKSINLKEIAERAVVRSGIFKRRLIHVAKKCGAISKDADYASVSISGLIEALKDTPVYTEALRVVFHEDLDLEKTKEVIEMLKVGQIRIELIDNPQLSPLARIGLEEITRRGEIVSPERLRSMIRLSTITRLNNTFVTLVCTKCWNFIELVKVSDLEYIKECKFCKSNYLTASDVPYEDVFSLSMKVKSGSELHGKYERLSKKLLKISELRSKFGHDVDIICAGKGLSINDIMKALDEVREGKDLIDTIIEAERESLRRRYFFSSP